MGVSYARYETSKDRADSQSYELFTMQEFNEGLGLPYRLDHERVKSVSLHKKNEDKLLFTHENTVLIHLLTQAALAITDSYGKLLVPSNFVMVEFTSPVDVRFFQWYFNDHPDIRRQIMKNTQGAIISTLSVGMLRELTINFPPLEKQKRLAKIIQLQSRKNQLLDEKKSLETQFVKQKLLNHLEAIK